MQLAVTGESFWEMGTWLEVEGLFPGKARGSEALLWAPRDPALQAGTVYLTWPTPAELQEDRALTDYSFQS